MLCPKKKKKKPKSGLFKGDQTFLVAWDGYVFWATCSDLRQV